MQNSFSLSRLGIGILLILSLILAALPLMAQEALTEVYVTDDEALAFSYPEGWFIDDSDPDIIVGSSDETTLEDGVPVRNSAMFSIIKPDIIALLFPRADNDDLEGLLGDFLESADITGISLEETTIGERTMAVADLRMMENPGMLLAIPLSDGSTAIFLAVANGDYADYEATLMAIAETIDVFDPAIHSTSTTEETPTDTGEPCLVMAEEAGAAALRVGPGFNRTELSSLAPDQPFTVLGEAEADDGSLWWKLNKEEALPESAAAEIWVNQEDVVATGDCTAIGTAEAPPIVPITTSSSTGDTGSAAVGGGIAGTGEGLFIPIPDWQVQLPPEMQASSAETAKYIANIITHWAEVDSAKYSLYKGGDSFTMYRYRVDYDITIVLRETGQEIARETFRGAEPPEFPDRWSYGGRLNGGPPEFANVLPWFQTVAGQ